MKHHFKNHTAGMHFTAGKNRSREKKFTRPGADQCNVAFKDATRLDSLVLRSSLRATFFSRLSGLFVNRHAFNDHAEKQARLPRSAPACFVGAFLCPVSWPWAKFHRRAAKAQFGFPFENFMPVPAHGTSGITFHCPPLHRKICDNLRQKRKAGLPANALS